MEAQKKSSRTVWIDYLRAFITLLVLYHHAAQAYTTYAQQNHTNFLWSTAPIVDSQRWAFLDYAENFNDVFFMSLMFCISGLFVWPILKEKGPRAFLRGRLLRLGIPFLVGVVLLMPVAYYPSWLSAGGPPGYPSYWLSFIKAGWSGGPLWFVWVLLAFDAIATGVFLLFRKGKAIRLAPRSAPKAFFVLFFISFFAYVPMLAHFGFGTWVAFPFPPFYFQIARVLLYLTWFFAGIIFGARGLENGLLAEDGTLARQWPWWVATCVIAYNLLWFGPGLVARFTNSKHLSDLTYVTLWVASCCASCFALLALFRRALDRRRPWMDVLARSAYIVYVIHYVFLTWIQYSLLGFAVSGAAKFFIACVSVIALSWLAGWLLLKSQRLRTIV